MKTNREYQRLWRSKHKPRKDGKPRLSYLQQRNALVAWQNGALSEGQACKLLGVDRVTGRLMVDEAINAALTEYELLKKGRGK